MIFKKIRKALVGGMAVFFLCSFTENTAPADSAVAASVGYGDGGEDKFNEELKELNPRLDEYNIMGKDHVEVKNELSEEDRYVIGKFVTLDEDRITLHEEVYKEMPVNDLGLSPERYKQETGEEFPVEKDMKFLANHKKLTFVSDNIGLMNFMAENDYGRILDDGTLEVHSDDFIQQSFIMNFHLGWFSMKFTANYQATIFFGAMGLLVNVSNIRNVKRLMNASKSDFVNCFKDVGWDLIQNTSSYWGNLITQNAIAAAGEVMSILSIASSSTWVGRVIAILQYILSHYLPGFLKGACMVLGGLFYHYGCACEIGLWWSNYNILYYRVTCPAL